MKQPLFYRTRPDLFEQICPHNNNIDEIKKLTSGSNKKVWWVCKNNKEHVWDDSITHRVQEGRGCPFCRGMRVNHTNSLESLNPALAEEFHPSKNSPATTNTIYAHSGKSIWWICKNGHEYEAPVSRRNPKNKSQGSGCKKCSNQTSLPEIRIYAELAYIFEDACWRDKFQGIEVDIMLPSLNIGIEYDGSYWHTKKRNKDIDKNIQLANKNILLVRFREMPLKKIEEIDILVDGKLKKEHLDDFLDLVISKCDESFRERINKYKEQSNFCNDTEYNRIVSFLPNPLPEKSLGHLFPEVSKEWDFQNNYPLRPENVSPHAGFSVQWVCSKGHSFPMTIGNRTGKTKDTQNGCPYCSGRYASSEDNLALHYPEVAKEYFQEKNGQLKVDSLRPKSNKKVWWKCSIQSHEPWLQSPNIRVGMGTGCPTCSGRLVSSSNSLIDNFPQLFDYWNFHKNEINFDSVSKGSHAKAHWKCPNCEIKWHLTIKDMVKRCRYAIENDKNICLNCRKLN